MGQHGRSKRTPSFCSLQTWERRKKGDTARRRPTRNNAGLEKLKKRARRATITSDVSRPNDRHLSRRSRYYAKSPLPFGDSARTASESYKQTACLRFSFPVPLSPSSSYHSPSIPLSLSRARARSRHQTGIRWWRTAKTRSTFIPRIYECLRIFRPLVREFVAGIQPKNYNRACIMSTP